MKISGLKIILKDLDFFLKKGGKLEIIAGSNYGLTEPKALKKINEIINGYKSSNLYLENGKNKQTVFHPKLYMFESDRECYILSGSANFTKGGFYSNNEISILLKTNITDKIWKSSERYFKNMINSKTVELATPCSISRYENFYNEQKKNRKNIRSHNTSKPKFNIQNLKSHFAEFDTHELKRNFELRKKMYIEAESVLDEIAETKDLTQDVFASLLDKLTGAKNISSLWRSGSLFRLRKKIYPQYNKFQELVRYIRENRNGNLDQVFDNGKKIIEKIDYAGINYLTEIMLTYNINDFANMNNNPLTVLIKEAELGIKKTPSSYNSNDYKEYCDIIKDISNQLGLKNMLEADTILSDIYWRIKKIELKKA
ncbi:MAG: hypothetical protein JXR90_00775 [Spirochaetes bacterium]|nr:hypothetical protein [Spirochaetota bacterium]